MSDEAKLTSCPSCGSSLGPFVASPDGPRQVVCSTCGTRGPYERVGRTAEQGWKELESRLKDLLRRVLEDRERIESQMVDGVDWYDEVERELRR